jgi:glycine/D-amino acid oxidase-like deaminating enzyme
MNLDVLIVGQGIAGTITSYQLINKGLIVGIIDNAIQNQSSKLASAIINPLSGKKWNQVAQFDTYLNDSLSNYKGIEQLIQQPVIQAKDHVYFFQNLESQETAKQNTNSDWYTLSQDTLFKNIESPFGYAQIKQCYCIDQKAMFKKWRHYMEQHYYFSSNLFDYQALTYENKKWRYNDIRANAIIFCEGINALNNPYFNKLPFTQNRGDVLYVNIEQLDNSYIYSFKDRLVPIKDQLFWLGSNHIWDYNTLDKNLEWAESCLKNLEKQLPYTIQLIDHKVAERPTTVGQKPLALKHDLHPKMGLLNGLGTRGFLQASTYCKILLEQMQL